MNRKRIICILLTVAAVMSALLTGCGNKAQSRLPASGVRQKVSFWYMWKNDEAKYIEKIIAAYNASQDKYEVAGTSVPDQMTIAEEISEGYGPDVADDFGTSIAMMAAKNIAMPLDDYIARDNVNMDGFVDGTISQQQYDDHTYALPVSSNITVLYYNKDLLKAAGYTEPPKTMEELQEMSVKMTKTDNGKITELGAPLVPAGYWWADMTYAYGTGFGRSGALTLDNEGFRSTLRYLSDYSEKFGNDAVSSFAKEGQDNINTSKDPFLLGQEALRIDGTWFCKMAEDAGVNFGLVPIPSYEAQGNKGYSYLETSNFFISSDAKDPEGAWDFIKYMTVGDGAKMFVTLKGDLPALRSLISDGSVTGTSGSYKVYLKVLSDAKLIPLPGVVQRVEFDGDLNAAVSSVMQGETVDDAIDKLERSAAEMK